MLEICEQFRINGSNNIGRGNRVVAVVADAPRRRRTTYRLLPRAHDLESLDPEGLVSHDMDDQPQNGLLNTSNSDLNCTWLPPDTACA